MPPNLPPHESADTEHMLPPAHKKPVGPIVGIIVIIILMIFGALYFWGARLNQQQNPPPYIPAENSTAAAR